MDNQLIYICSYLVSPIRDEYSKEWFSRAGLNEKKGTVTSLRHNGCEITVISPVVPDKFGISYHSTKKYYFEHQDIQIFIPPTINIGGVFVVNYIFTIISSIFFTLFLSRRYYKELVLSYNFQPETVLPGLAMKLSTNSALILQYEDGLFVHQNLLRRYSAKVCRIICNQWLDGAVCTNQELSKTLKTENTTVFRGYPSIGYPDSLPDPLFDDGSNVVVMFAGSFDKIRGVDYFLDIIELIKNQNVEFWITGVGSPRRKKQIQNRVQSLGDDRIKFIGTVPWEEYRARVVSADILVNTQDPNAPISAFTFPSKLLDFMSAGGLIVTTDISDLQEEFQTEMIIDGTTTQSFATCLSDAIRMVGGEDEVYRKRAIEWIKANTTHEFAGGQYKSIFEKAKS